MKYGQLDEATMEMFLEHPALFKKRYYYKKDKKKQAGYVQVPMPEADD